MDSSQNYPPPPKEMYIHRHKRQVNGHILKSRSPTRCGPPPLLPQRKLETQLSVKTIRTTSSHMSTPSGSLDNAGLRRNDFQHQQHLFQQGRKVYPEKNTSIHTTVVNSDHRPHSLSSNDDKPSWSKIENGDLIKNEMGDNRSAVNLNKSNFYRVISHEEPVMLSQNTIILRQRAERSRERGASRPRSLVDMERGSLACGAFHAVQSGKHSTNYDQYLKQSGISPNRPSLTYIPPPTVPVIQVGPRRSESDAATEQWNYERHQMLQKSQQYEREHMSGQQQHPQQLQYYHTEQHQLQQYQTQQQRTTDHIKTAPAGITTNNATQNINYHHQPSSQQQQHLHHLSHHKQQHRNSTTSSTQHPQNVSTSPSVSFSHARTNTGIELETGRILIRPPISPANASYGSTRQQSSPHSLISPETTNKPPKIVSSTNATMLIRPSPLTLTNPNSVTQSSSSHTICLSEPQLHPYHYQLVDFKPIDNPASIHLQIETPSNQAPPPAPPPRTSSTVQLPPQSRRDLNHASSKDVKPSCIMSSTEHPKEASHDNYQARAATVDDIVNVKLRSVNDSSSPRLQVMSPLSPQDINTGATNVRLRHTPGRFSNIYAEEDITLLPPPPIDDLDELPPPPPPQELLCDNIASLAFEHVPPYQNNISPSLPLHNLQPHTPPGETHLWHAHHMHTLAPQQNQLLTKPSPKPTHHNGSSLEDTSSESCAGSGIEKFTPVSDRQLPESMSNMDFEIPNDIDLSKCPGLVEINKSTPNWKKDMIEKKNQEKIEEYVKKIQKERAQEAKWKNVPEWKKKILQKKEDEDVPEEVSPVAEIKPETVKTGKKPVKKPPVPPPKEVKEDIAALKPKGDIIPAALSIAPEELAAMPPWKRELLFKRDKVPVTFSNEYNPEGDSNSDNDNTTGS